MRTLPKRKKIVFTVLSPPVNGAGEFPDRKNSQHFPGKTGFPSGATLKKSCTQCTCTCTTPNKIQNHRKSPYKLCLKKACLLCSPPSSALVKGSIFFDPPIVNIHMVKTRLRTGVPRSPKSSAPICSLYAPPHGFSCIMCTFSLCPLSRVQLY